MASQSQSVLFGCFGARFPLVSPNPSAFIKFRPGIRLCGWQRNGFQWNYSPSPWTTHASQGAYLDPFICAIIKFVKTYSQSMRSWLVGFAVARHLGRPTEWQWEGKAVARQSVMRRSHHQFQSGRRRTVNEDVYLCASIANPIPGK